MYHLENPDADLKQLFEDLAGFDVKLYSSTSQAVQSVVSGENVACLFCSAGIAFGASHDSGAPVDFVLPADATFAKPTFLGVSAKPAHPKAALLFFNWVTSTDGLRVYSEIYRSTSVAAGAPDDFPTIPDSENLGADLEEINKNAVLA